MRQVSDVFPVCVCVCVCVQGPVMDFSLLDSEARSPTLSLSDSGTPQHEPACKGQDTSGQCCRWLCQWLLRHGRSTHNNDDNNNNNNNNDNYNNNNNNNNNDNDNDNNNNDNNNNENDDNNNVYQILLRYVVGMLLSQKPYMQ